MRLMAGWKIPQLNGGLNRKTMRFFLPDFLKNPGCLETSLKPMQMDIYKGDTN